MMIAPMKAQLTGGGVLHDREHDMAVETGELSESILNEEIVIGWRRKHLRAFPG